MDITVDPRRWPGWRTKAEPSWVPFRSPPRPPSLCQDSGGLVHQSMIVKIWTAQGTKYHYVENGSRRQELVLLLHDFSDFWYGWRSQVTLSDNCIDWVSMNWNTQICFQNRETKNSICTNSQLRGLSGSNWVVAPDLKGFGDSDKPFLARQYRDEV